MDNCRKWSEVSDVMLVKRKVEASQRFLPPAQCHEHLCNTMFTSPVTQSGKLLPSHVQKVSFTRTVLFVFDNRISESFHIQKRIFYNAV